MDDPRETARTPGGAVRRLIARLFGIVPTLDLHGLGVPRALSETDRFLDDAVRLGAERVRIVYGKGRGSPGGVGVLRQAIPAWLEQHGRGRIARFERQLDPDGNDGAMIVWLAGGAPQTPS